MEKKALKKYILGTVLEWIFFSFKNKRYRKARSVFPLFSPFLSGNDNQIYLKCLDIDTFCYIKLYAICYGVW